VQRDFLVERIGQRNTTEYEKAGALKGLIGKTGEKPARSRHCKAERIRKASLRKLGRPDERMKPSQENCLFLLLIDLRAMGRRWKMLFSISYIHPAQEWIF